MMYFWNNGHPGNHAAFIEEEETILFSELDRDVQACMEKLHSETKELLFLLCKNTYSTICLYLAALRGGKTVCLLPASLDPGLLAHLIESYQPEWLAVSDLNAGGELSGYETFQHFRSHTLFQRRKVSEHPPIHPELALLLSTSGTTGSPKMVRLSYDNLQANASSIVEYLKLNGDHRPITTLPMSYSYGLSVINSHLLAGACTILTEESIVSRTFWDQFNTNRAASIAGVPYTYQMLRRLKFAEMDLPSLKQMTQAGGRLPADLQRYFGEVCSVRGIEFYVMYGQTEATARMSYLPPEKMLTKPGSIGIVIPNGNLRVDEQEELIYAGPNVMLGYAESRGDLKRGDEQHSVLRTGDLAEFDEDGYCFIKGRLKRFVKPFGLRINLDDIESYLEKKFAGRFFCVGNDTKIVILCESEPLLEVARLDTLQRYGLHHSTIKAIRIDDVPILNSGKTDYSVLQRKAGIE